MTSPEPDIDQSATPSGTMRDDLEVTTINPSISGSRAMQKVYTSKKGRGRDSKKGSQKLQKGAKVEEKGGSEKPSMQDPVPILQKEGQNIIQKGIGCELPIQVLGLLRPL